MHLAKIIYLKKGVIDFMEKHCWKIVEHEPSIFADASKKYGVQSPDRNFREKYLTQEEAEAWCDNAFAQVGEDIKNLLQTKLGELVKKHISEFGEYYRGILLLGGADVLDRKAYDFTTELDMLRYELRRCITVIEYDYISSQIKPLVLIHVLNSIKENGHA
ncbi:hypothetical protein EHV15_35815 [Paenibacillus oralis]|uniref:Uncharacterized protein n=1 Tax=Paenibacillus oralis TaxID=2490856 RepID=A0A3P3TAG3_9BACL|nr:hypothetical protein [Paenibacillus oralis]RRJ54940.1 hypothetical protein EHV15_35815 [Paenibacillus oralis]